MLPGVSSLVHGAKRQALGVLKATGTYAVIRDSRWRARRLLILCYHGVSLDDEHEWNPTLYISPRQFESRLETLRRHRYSVLPLADGLEALRHNDLPPRSVTLTFDDGTHDFYTRAFPALESRQLPATVYLTTYYCELGKPVFNLMCNYLFWKGRERQVSLAAIVGVDESFDLRDPVQRQSACDQVVSLAERERYTSADKQLTVERLSAALQIDYAALASRQLLHIMRPGEVRALAARGVDFQLHTHRHRSPLDRDLFLGEIKDNRRSIQRMTDRRPAHFCYPSGLYRPEFRPWLQEEDVHSATTCDPGLATPSSSLFELPRFVDNSLVSPVVFEGWLTGAASWLPRKRSYANG